MTRKLIILADKLDKLGLNREADIIDQLIREGASPFDTPPHKYPKLTDKQKELNKWLKNRIQKNENKIVKDEEKEYSSKMKRWKKENPEEAFKRDEQKLWDKRRGNISKLKFFQIVFNNDNHNPIFVAPDYGLTCVSDALNEAADWVEEHAPKYLLEDYELSERTDKNGNTENVTFLGNHGLPFDSEKIYVHISSGEDIFDDFREGRKPINLGDKEWKTAMDGDEDILHRLKQRISD